jgi:cobalt-precorrin 5A hydrolase
MKLVAGLGFRAGCEVESLRSALQAALDLASTACGQPINFAHLSALATAADKAQHPALLQLAAELHIPIHPIPLPTLADQPAAPSTHVPERYGAHSVAEASALAAAGPGATLLSRRSISPDHKATAALAAVQLSETPQSGLCPSAGVAPCKGGGAGRAAPQPGGVPISIENTSP